MSGFWDVFTSGLNAVMGKSGGSSGAEKAAVLDLLDNNLMLITAFIQMAEEHRGANLRRVGEFVKQQKGRPGDNAMADVYRTYLATVTNLHARAEERDLFLGSFYNAYLRFKRDHQLIRSNFATLMDGASHQVKLAEAKATQAIVIGYLEQVALVTEWVAYFIGNIQAPSAGGVAPLPPPPYQLAFIKDNLVPVAMFISVITGRANSATIMTEVEQIRKNGGDVYLTSGGQTIADYGNERDYAPVSQLAMRGFFRSLPIMIGDWLATREHEKRERNTAMRDWMLNKVAVLSADLSRVDPNSAEYKRQVAVIDAYTKRISAMDEEILRYEG